LRILLPALQPSIPRTGVANYIRELVRAWNSLGTGVPDLVVAAACPDEFQFLGDGDPVRVSSVKVFGPGVAGRIGALHMRIPRMARAVGADVILSPNFISPLLGNCKTAVVVQDLAFVHFASTIPAPRRMYYHALVRSSIRRAAAVLVATRAMAEEVAEFEPSVASRIRIASLGVSSAHLATVPEPVNTPAGDFLCVGTLEPRKNLARVLSAHGRLCRRFRDFPDLRLVGGKGWGRRTVADMLAGHPEPGKVKLLGYLTDEELRTEYRHARGLVFCSLYEGFGLPVVEAMQHGCPVLCSRGTALAEVAAGAALLADPQETGEIEQAMLRLNDDAQLRLVLARAGRLRAREFTWERCARRTIDALKELAA
jgi:glycosyltransferase involved in cell wall biosynthesis